MIRFVSAGGETGLAIHDKKVNIKHFTAVNMASNFSGVLQLTDLDDFITPSQVATRLKNVTFIPEQQRQR